MNVDAIEVVEAAYRYDGDRHAWLDGIASALQPHLPGDAFLVRGDYGLSKGAMSMRNVMLSREHRDRLPQATLDRMTATNEGLLNHVVDEQYPGLEFWLRGGWTALPLRQGVGPDTAPQFLGPLTEYGVVDVVAMVCRRDLDHGVFFSHHSTRVLTIDPLTDRRLRRLGLHIASADRLWQRVGSAVGPDAPTAEVVLYADGRVADARSPEAQAPELLQRLRARVRDIDRARSGLRRTDSGIAALDLWKALVDGTWALVDVFDTDGRRFVVAHRNPPGLRDPRNWTPRESQVAHQAMLGHGNPAIGYALGIGASAVGTHIGNLMRKLRCTTRAQLIATLRATQDAQVVRIRGLSLLVGSAEPGAAGDLGRLTPAERDVVQLVAEGLTNVQIAARRGVGVPTVAKQLASVYQKLGVASRGALMAKILRPA